MSNLQAYYHIQSYVISVHRNRVNVHARLYIIAQNKARVNGATVKEVFSTVHTWMKIVEIWFQLRCGGFQWFHWI